MNATPTYIPLMVLALSLIVLTFVIATLVRGMFGSSGEEPEKVWLPAKARVVDLQRREVGGDEAYGTRQGVLATVVRPDGSSFVAWSFDTLGLLRGPARGAWIPVWFEPGNITGFRLKPPPSKGVQWLQTVLLLFFFLAVLTPMIFFSWKALT